MAAIIYDRVLKMSYEHYKERDDGQKYWCQDHEFCYVRDCTCREAQDLDCVPCRAEMNCSCSVHGTSDCYVENNDEGFYDMKSCDYCPVIEAYENCKCREKNWSIAYDYEWIKKNEEK